MKKLLARIIHIEKEEKIPVALLLLWGLFIGIALVTFNVGTTTLFLNHFGSSQLPLAFIISGLLGIAATSLFASLQNLMAYARLAVGCFAIFLLVTIGLYIGIAVRPAEWVIFLAFSCSIPISSVVMLIFWGIFSRIFDARQNKRLSIGIDAGITLAAMTVCFAIPLLQQVWLTEIQYFILTSSVSLGIACIVLLVLLSRFALLAELQVNAQYIHAHNNLTALFHNKYFILLTSFCFVSALAIAFVNFSFLTLTAAYYKNIDDLSGFLAVINGVIIFLAFAIKTFLNRRIIDTYGLKISLIILPAVLAVFTVIALIVGFRFGYQNPENRYFVLFFVAIAFSKVMADVFQEGLESPAFRFFLLPIDAALRPDIQVKTEGIVKNIAVFTAGLSLTALGLLAYFHVIHSGFILLLISTAWIFIGIRMYISYREVLKNTLEKQQRSIKTAKSGTAGLISQIEQNIQTIPLEKLPEYLNVLQILNPGVYKKAIITLLTHNNDRIQQIALLQAQELCLLDAIPILNRIMLSRYFPVMQNSGLITRVYGTLRGAEYRLEKLKYIEQLTYSKLTHERRFGAALSAYADEVMKAKLLNKLFRDANERVRYQAVASAAGSKNPDLHNSLIEKLDSPLYSNAAVSALIATGEQVFPALESAFYMTGQEEKIQLRIIQIYGSIGTVKAVELLLKKLSYPNQNIISATLDALSQSNFNVGAAQSLLLKRELEEVCNTLAWNMSFHLDLQREGCSTLLMQAMESEIATNRQTIFKLLALLYDPTSVALVEKNINSGDIEAVEFATELLDVFLAEESKPMLLPILNEMPYPDKLERLQNAFPTEAMIKREVVQLLIQKDYKWINRWTKACAIHELSSYDNPEDTRIFIANLINPHPMLREAAAQALFKRNAEVLHDSMQRFNNKLHYITDNELLSKPDLIEEASRLQIPVLKFDIVKTLSEIDCFREIPGLVLSEIAKILHVTQYQSQETIAEYGSVEDMDYFIIHSGSLRLIKDGVVLKLYEERAFIHNLGFINEQNSRIILKAETEAVVYKIPKDTLNELFSFYDIIPDAILRYRAAVNREIVFGEAMVT